MTTAIVHITEEHAPSFHACLDAVAREKRYLAQVEALPLERVAAFVKDSVKNNAAQYVALVGFVHEGRKRKRMWFDGVYFDALAMGLLFDAAPT